MNNLLTILIGTLLLANGSTNAVSTLGNNTFQSGDSIQSIRQRYASINQNLAKYRKVKKELSGFSAEGGELVAYFSGPSIVKIVANYYGESGKSFEEFYYWKGRLIFVYRKESTYDKPLSGKVVTAQENRFYFSGDRLLKWIDQNGKDVASGSSEYQEKQNEYVKTSKQFTEGSRSKKSTIQAVD